MKPFDLELAKAGYPICTRDGRDAIFMYESSVRTFDPILAVIKTESGDEIAVWYRTNGMWNQIESSNDLFMKSEKKAVWKNFYKTSLNSVYCDTNNYMSEEDARSKIFNSVNYICTKKVEWEE